MAPGQHHSSLGRARQIAEILARYELWSLVDMLDLAHLMPFHRIGPDRRGEAQQAETAQEHEMERSSHTRPMRLRLALAELGPTFMKLGQMLATRADLLPPAYQSALATLDDAAPTVSLEAVRATITAELGQPPERAFATFEATPLAAASIGQAHRATLPDGTAVVVKVRRPGAAEQIDEDLKLLHSLAVIASRRSARARQYDVVGLVQEFDTALRAELDYLREGHNAERFARDFAGDDTVTIPRVFWSTTTARVLTLERLEGLKVSDRAALDRAGLDRAALAGRGARLVLKMIFADGFFHADLHPGNLFIEEGGRIGLIDFGQVGTVDASTRQSLGHLMLAVVHQDAAGMADALLELGTARQPVDRRALGHDLAPLLACSVGQPLGTLAVGPLLTGVLAIMRRYHLVLPADLALLLKTLSMTEGMAAQLDPSFHLMEALAPYARRLLLQEYSPPAWMTHLRKEAPDLVWLATELPHHLRQVLGELEEGTLTVRVQPAGLEPLLRRVERSANRVVLGVIVAALISGLTILLAASHPGGSVRVLDTAFTLAAVVAAGLGLALIWSIMRSERR